MGTIVPAITADSKEIKTRKEVGNMVLDLNGSPYEMGKKHGEVMREQIVENVGIVRNVIENIKKMDMDVYMKHVYRNMEFVKQDRPDSAEEMQGLADGAGVPLDDIYLINVQLLSLIHISEPTRH